MSIDMYVGSSQAQASSVSRMCRQQKQSYQQLQQAIGSFVLSSDQLQGKTYDSAKQYFASVLTPLAKGGMLLTEAVEQACKKFPSEYAAKVDSGDLKQSELEQKIRALERQINVYQQIIQMMNAAAKENDIMRGIKRSFERTLRTHEKAKEKLEKKLRKLLEFNASSPSIFSEIAALEAAVNQGAEVSGSCWNASTGTFRMPSADKMSWAKTINDYQTTKAVAALMEQYGLTEELAKDIATFNKRFEAYAKKNGLSVEEQNHLYALLIASVSGAYTNKMWKFAGGTVDVDVAMKRLKEMGYSDEEIEKFQYSLQQNHNGRDNINQNDFVHMMGSLSVMINTNPGSDVVMKIGTSTSTYFNFANFIFGLKDINQSSYFLISSLNDNTGKNAAATYRGDIASASLDICDVRADIDALNIYNRAKSQPNVPITEIMSQYANDLNNGGNRAKELAEHFGEGDFEKGKDKFYNEIYTAPIDPGNLVLMKKDGKSISDTKKAANEFWRFYEQELKGK
ncbi:T7SS effector LXG polymorphic toxin [Enterococcus sp. AZ109]|uniref:T7SS effector LXG polymorphic toxin n=1 Tax=Enterococcus sp. AZ109 TaxID=2774634 RepID=UPI003F230037